MHRIAAALLIAAAGVALNAGMLRDAFARDVPPPAASGTETLGAGSSSLVSLLMVLEALRQPPDLLGGPKV